MFTETEVIVQCCTVLCLLSEYSVVKIVLRFCFVCCQQIAVENFSF